MFEAKQGQHTREGIDVVEEQILIGMLAEESVRALLVRRDLPVSLSILGTVHTKESQCVEALISGERVHVASALTLIHAWRWDVLHREDGEVQ